MIQETISKVTGNIVGAGAGAAAFWFGSHKMGITNTYARVALALTGAVIGAHVQAKMHKPTVTPIMGTKQILPPNSDIWGEPIKK